MTYKFGSVKSHILSILCVILLAIPHGYGQEIDLKLRALGSSTAYTGSYALGFGTGLDINLTDKISSSLNYNYISKDISSIIHTGSKRIDFGYNLISDKNNIFELNFYYSLLGSRSSKFNTKVGAGIIYQNSRTKYLANLLATNEVVTLLDERTSVASTNRLSIQIEQQFNLTKRLNFSVGISKYFFSSSKFPSISSSFSSTTDGITTSSNNVFSNAPYNNLMYSFSVGYRIFEI